MAELMIVRPLHHFAAGPSCNSCPPLSFPPSLPHPDLTHAHTKIPRRLSHTCTAHAHLRSSYYIEVLFTISKHAPQRAIRLNTSTPISHHVHSCLSGAFPRLHTAQMGGWMLVQAFNIPHTWGPTEQAAVLSKQQRIHGLPNCSIGLFERQETAE